MHNLTTNFGKFLDICNKFGKRFTNAKGNISRRGVIPKSSDLEMVALSLTAEALSIDTECLLFSKLNSEYKSDFPNLISWRQYNDRRKIELAILKNLICSHGNILYNIIFHRIPPNILLVRENLL